jgi:MoxR-like ATPase
VEFRGTYPLPEAQMDRFAMQFDLGYVSTEQEVAVLSAQATNHPLENVQACASLSDVALLKQAVQQVRISEELKHYIVKVVSATRTAAGVQLGASPRASIALMKTAQALALIDGDDCVYPEHIQEVASPVIAHRLVLDPQARFSGTTNRSIITDVLKRIPVPA